MNQHENKAQYIPMGIKNTGKKIIDFIIFSVLLTEINLETKDSIFPWELKTR